MFDLQSIGNSAATAARAAETVIAWRTSCQSVVSLLCCSHSNGPAPCKRCGKPAREEIWGMIRTRAAFSLIEILVVVAAIAVLVAVLLPMLSKSREQNCQFSCNSNQQQIYQALLSAQQDQRERWPGQPGMRDAQVWLQHAKTYAPTDTMWRCPSNLASTRSDATDYGFNPQLYGVAKGELTAPAHTVLLADAHTPLLRTAGEVAQRHAGGYIACFADGHCTYMAAGGAQVIFADGDAGHYFAFGVRHTPITFTGEAAATGASGVCREGSVVALVNSGPHSITPTITVQGGVNAPAAGLIPGVSPTILAAGQSRAFTLRCRTAANGVKVDTTYIFGEHPAVSLSVPAHSTPAEAAEPAVPTTD